jgi:hypothetical protein
LSVLTIISWRLSTLTDRYAWEPRGNDTQILNISLSTIFLFKVIFWLIVLNGALFAFISYVRGRKTISLLSGAVVVVICFFGGRLVNRELTSSYFSIFRNQSVPEEYIERPLVESGYEMGPRLVEYIQDESVKNRRYAISALGKIGYEPATPVLSTILFDLDEPDYIRAEAWQALRSFGTDETEKIIAEFDTKGDTAVLNLVRLDKHDK